MEMGRDAEKTQRDAERYEEAQRGADGHRERCSGIGLADVEVVRALLLMSFFSCSCNAYGTSADVVVPEEMI